MTSVISSFFTRDPRASFPYEIPVEYSYNTGGISIGNSFRKSEPSEECTCFSARNVPTAVSSLKTQARKLKTLRHPNILIFVDSLEVESSYYLITELCMPLKTYIERTEFTSQQKYYIATWGLYQLLNCLKFLHDEAKLSHDNLCNSVYVTKSGDWKVSGLDCAVSFTNSRKDLNDLAIIMWKLFNDYSQDVSKPPPPGKVPADMQSLYKMLASAQASRFTAERILIDNRKRDGFLKNAYVDNLLFLDEFQLKDTHDKRNFLIKLQDELEMYPSDISKYKILPNLINSYEYGDAGSDILVPLVKLSHLLNELEYQRIIVPCLCKLFASTDRATRVKLLEKIDQFATNLRAEVVNEKIFGNLIFGFSDSNPLVRESTVKAMVTLADKLNYHNLNTELMKHFARLQGIDPEPGIRTNTTICLSKIACYIDPSQRQKILISAFTRALKDPFPPSRIAAVLAFSATQQFYLITDIANRIVPALAPSTCDSEKQVRDHSFKALRGFIDKLERASENPELIAELESQVKAGGAGSLLSSEKVPQWASWALKSLSSKFAKTSSSYSSSGLSKNDDSDRIDSSNKPTGDPVLLSSSKSVKTPESSVHSDSSKSELLEDGVKSKEWNDRIDGDVGSDGWDSIPKQSAIANTKKMSAQSKNTAKLSVGGTMKLVAKASNKSCDECIDFLLGVAREEGTDPSQLGKSSENEDATCDDWDIDNSWSSFAENVESSTVAENSVEDWKDSSWGQEMSCDARKVARRAEQHSRNEEKRKALSSKRTTKGIGAVKLGNKS